MSEKRTLLLRAPSAPSFPRKREVLFNGDCRSSILRLGSPAQWMPASAGLTPGISDTSGGVAAMDLGRRNRA
ncbi:hypothetical protein [Dyella sp.]|jgi:hypothetical protein|uniref:hypothetical protein n=1 Tax=Dyella sp. TaxID=1869338 RepID=UPI002D76BF64|nr:hypothetical protein [Dyella sp.]HET6431388.1 hypothetical protein [Dyella sp.]